MVLAAVCERADAGEQRLVEPDRGDGTETVRVVDQGAAVDDDGLHHHVPATAEIVGHLSDGAAMLADLHRRLARRSRRHRTPARADLRVWPLLNGGHRLTDGEARRVSVWRCEGA